MSGLPNIRAISRAREEGRFHSATMRKAVSAGTATTLGWWQDLGGSPGNPLPQYYASTPLAAAAFDPFKGIFHGDDKAPAEKYLVLAALTTPTAAMLGQYKLMDYLLYYPFVDGDDTDTQLMDNTVQLDRYTQSGGRVIAVAQAPTVGGGSFFYTYINQDGVEKTSPTINYNTTASGIGSLVTTEPAVAGSSPGPFLTLANGDTSVRSITSVQNLGPTGGLICLIIVRPLMDIVLREINSVNEVELASRWPALVRIYDGAYLNLISNVAGSIASGTLHGYFDFIWSE